MSYTDSLPENCGSHEYIWTAVYWGGRQMWYCRNCHTWGRKIEEARKFVPGWDERTPIERAYATFADPSHLLPNEPPSQELFRDWDFLVGSRKGIPEGTVDRPLFRADERSFGTCIACGISHARACPIRHSDIAERFGHDGDYATRFPDNARAFVNFWVGVSSQELLSGGKTSLPQSGSRSSGSKSAHERNGRTAVIREFAKVWEFNFPAGFPIRTSD